MRNSDIRLVGEGFLEEMIAELGLEGRVERMGS